MSAFYCPPEDIKGDTLLLTGEEAHHLTRVMRHRVGDVVAVVDGTGGEYDAGVETLSPERVECRIKARRRRTAEPIAQVVLAQALAKGAHFDLVVEKATEVGVAGILPMTTERTVVVLEEEGRRERWRKIAISAMKQSERSVLPAIEKVCEFRDVVLRAKEYDLALIAWESEREKLRDLMKFARSVRKVLVLVGPEGGFSEDEVNLARSKHLRTFSMGTRKLRTETAGILAVALVLHELGDLG
jgi:16S rRNA (uracil1498-N3)-methyltransferase